MPLNLRKRRRGRRVLVPLLALAIASGAGGAASAAGPTSAGTSSPVAQATTHPACHVPALGHAACLAVVDDRPIHAPRRPGTRAAAATEPHAYTAADLQAAYRLPSALLGARQTIAIVDAFDNPEAEEDLAVYRETNGLPACDEDF